MLAINYADWEGDLSKQHIRQSMQSLKLNAAKKQCDDHNFNGFCWVPFSVEHSPQ